MRPAAILFDRDGTLVVNVPYNGDPDRVVLAPGAREALDRVRAAGIRTAVITNQSGVGRGMITLQQVFAVNGRVEAMLGDVGPWIVCPHHPDAGCPCRKPAPGLILQAAEALGVDPADCVVIGDRLADVQAAAAAGARGILVPSADTAEGERERAGEVCGGLLEAVERALVASPSGEAT